ncbi:hypothetical protein BDW59DRAFT_165417 [Aspergillus cavernicola]|uniref:Uncharacterized protein n=1 Tax=Aspergillus cavernicola TaxID=176166 RepID=A0ABR4HSJ6_9EURO
MASVTEQIFLYGEADPEPVTGLQAVIEYADLMISGSFVFALIILATIIATYWEVIAPVFIKGAKKLILSTGSVASKAVSLLKLLLSIRSYSELDTMYATAKFVALQTILGRFITAVIVWYFPFDRPEKTMWRVVVTGIAGMTAHSTILIPLRLYLIILRNDVRDLVREYNATLFEMLGEIHHLHAVGFVASFFLSVAFLWYLFDTLVKALASWRAFLRFTASQTVANAATIDTETDLRTTIRNYEAGLKIQRSLLAARTQELETANERRQGDSGTLEREAAARDAARESESRLSEEKRALQQELVQKDCQLSMSRLWRQEAEKEKESKVQDLTRQIMKLEDRLEEEMQTKKALPGHSESLKASLQLKEDELNLAFRHLADAQAREGHLQEQCRANDIEIQRLATLNAGAQAREGQLQEQCRAKDTHIQQLAAQPANIRAREEQLEQQCQQKDTRIHQLVAKNTELQRTNSSISLESELYQGLLNTNDEAFKAFKTAKKKAQDKHDQITGALEQQLASTRAEAQSKVTELLLSVNQAHQAKANLELAMKDLKSACDSTIKEMRGEVEAKALRQEVSELKKEITDYDKKIGLAMRDAQRSLKQSSVAQQQELKAQKTIEILEHRLKKWESVPSSQEFPKRQMSSPGSVSTALEQSNLKVVERQNEIDQLRRQLGEAKTASEESRNAAIKQLVEKLQAALQKEREERKEDRILWHKRNLDLEGENRKLRLSASRPSPGRRGPYPSPGPPIR